MPLRFPNGQSFAVGCIGYTYRPATEHETAPRIIIEVEIHGIETQAMVDTGGVFLIRTPTVAKLLRLDAQEALGEDVVVLRGIRITGNLHRVNLTLAAEEGRSLTVEATALIPHEQREEQWVEDLPCFLGLQGCLERLRFAVDPSTEKFYFGPVG
jgi:hypothetical protein